jgi:hypothetical protein
MKEELWPKKNNGSLEMFTKPLNISDLLKEIEND